MNKPTFRKPTRKTVIAVAYALAMTVQGVRMTQLDIVRGLNAFATRWVQSHGLVRAETPAAEVRTVPVIVKAESDTQVQQAIQASLK